MLNIFVNILIQAKKHIAAGSISLAMILILIYQLGGAILDAIASLGNIQVPDAYYGVLSLLFIFGIVYMWLRGRGED